MLASVSPLQKRRSSTRSKASASHQIRFRRNFNYWFRRNFYPISAQFLL
jgi:hypothetical protein